ncbi:TIGR01906 family membrane protein [Lachnoclostridium sp. An181]|uniref:TIGR01906 family membrane protein n=1 Tax=Lachnoclostridium sp. An181 TaxID=1965575 RepID=UPI000B3A37C2|nr:TIGR01906 family membrane protein [Lachnoclostridium sp. An181]OUP51275.1 hypothetical protein B5F18_00755 [Lachnoclostridium sp. An181]
MKSLRRITVVLASLCLFIVLLLTSFEVAIYGDNEYKFYQKEYEKYQVQEKLDMEMDDIMYVTEEMMSYLHGEREELSVMVKVEGKQQDFFNDQDRFHMGEVKVLFLGGLKLRNILACFAVILFAVALFLKPRKGEMCKTILATLAGIVCALVVIGILCAVNFDAVFVTFHHIFFDNDLWLFDPATDYMIRMLPEGFFFDMVVRIGMTFAGALAAVAAGLFLRLWCVKKK